ncbi:MAG: NAD(P)-binding domain-containing protein [Paludibacteraceae bacterium]|nr:NAD(P)-binding domain-containing protein [Paludibacteraceae bacterium]
MKRVLVAHALFPESFSAGTNKIEIIKPQKGAFSSEELASLIPTCDAFISMFNTPVPAHLLELGKKLEVISNVGVGYNNIDVDAATRLGITVCNTPDVVTEPTAELTIAFLLDLARGITRSHVIMQQNQERWGVLENIGTSVYGKTLGIVGFGRIGKAVAKRALALGMRIVYYSRTKQAETVQKEYQATYVSLNELMQTADFISLHTPLTPQTHHLIGQKELALCKPTAYLINTARGAVIHEESLIQALQQGAIAGAALDVYEYEPQVPAAMRSLPNVLMVPHIGTATRETRNAMAAMALENVVEYFNGNPLRVVNP